MMVDESDEGEIIINEVDGLPSLHDSGYSDVRGIDFDDSNISFDELINDEDLPTSLIVTSIDTSVFHDEELKNQLESIFKQFGDSVTFQYFRSFKRIRVNYSSPASAAKARIHLHHTRFCDCLINCYFAQPVTPIDAADKHLQLPAPVKQFLISPPSSPPVGWEPRDESDPLINYDLIAALANLTPGMPHELHAGSDNQPGIVVHVCDETGSSSSHMKPTIMHTSRPETN